MTAAVPGTRDGLPVARIGMGEPSSGGLPAGLVPVAFSFSRQRVRLLDLRGISLGEQAFRLSVERWTAEHPDRRPVELSWSEFLEMARETPCAPPAGLLFNVARCGSTLLANMLGAPAGHVALKESSTIGVLLHHWRRAETEAEREQIEQVLAATVPLYGRLSENAVDDAAQVRLFVKPHSLALVSAEALLRPFPQTPALFLWRDPTEAVASMLAKPVYGGLYDAPREDLMTVFPSLAQAPVNLSPAAFNAHLWRSPVEAALALPPDRLLLVDYAELVGNPGAAIERLARHFRLDPSPETLAQMYGVMGVYSKDARGTTRFDPAGAHHRPPLNAEQHADAQAVLGNLHAHLLRRQHVSNPTTDCVKVDSRDDELGHRAYQTW